MIDRVLLEALCCRVQNDWSPLDLVSCLAPVLSMIEIEAQRQLLDWRSVTKNCIAKRRIAAEALHMQTMS